MTDTLLQLKNVSKYYHGKTILDNISLDIHKGEVLCLIGPSGAGKTTLLKTLNLIIHPDSGYIEFNGKQIYSSSLGNGQSHSFSMRAINWLLGKNNDGTSKDILVELNAYRRNFGMVFQEFNLWPNLTLFDNIAAPLKWSMYLPENEIGERVEEVARLVRIENLLKKYPNQASGGQKQRAGIARALVVKPSILLLDEITSALDPELVSGILDLIEELRALGNTMVIVTHHIEFARKVADRVAFIKQSRVVECGDKNKILSSAATNELTEFLSHISREDHS